MIVLESRVSTLSVAGRVADELTRADIGPRRFTARLRGNQRSALLKQDGSFAFADVAPPGSYTLELSGPEFQSRELSAVVIATLVTRFPGEDELHVIVTDLPGGNRVTFAPLAFVPTIPADAAVRGPGAFATTLAEDVEGSTVNGADLQSVAGLAVGDELRIVRSDRLLLRPGPYYRCPAGMTIVALRVRENVTDGAPIADAVIDIDDANGTALTSTTVDGVDLFRADLPPAGGGAATPFMFGPRAAIRARTNARGDAVFYYAASTPLTSLTITATAGARTATVTASVVAGERTFTDIPL